MLHTCGQLRRGSSQGGGVGSLEISTLSGTGSHCGKFCPDGSSERSQSQIRLGLAIQPHGERQIHRGSNARRLEGYGEVFLECYSTKGVRKHEFCTRAPPNALNNFDGCTPDAKPGIKPCSHEVYSATGMVCQAGEGFRDETVGLA